MGCGSVEVSVRRGAVSVGGVGAARRSREVSIWVRVGPGVGWSAVVSVGGIGAARRSGAVSVGVRVGPVVGWLGAVSVGGIGAARRFECGGESGLRRDARWAPAERRGVGLASRSRDACVEGRGGGLGLSECGGATGGRADIHFAGRAHGATARRGGVCLGSGLFRAV